MSHEDCYIERLVPSEIDRSDPDQLRLLLHSEHQYGIASFFVEDKDVLDIGCGVGFGASILLKNGKAKSILGVDSDSACIDMARRDYRDDSIEYRCCGYEDLNGALQFDAVVCLNMIEHLRDPGGPVTFARKNLVSGGDLIISTWVTPTSDFNPTHFSDFTVSSFRKIVRHTGFQIQHEYLCYKRFRPGRAVKLAKNKKADFENRTGPRSLIKYYCKHPGKAFLRARSLVIDGFILKNLLIHAVSTQ